MSESAHFSDIHVSKRLRALLAKKGGQLLASVPIYLLRKKRYVQAKRWALRLHNRAPLRIRPLVALVEIACKQQQWNVVKARAALLHHKVLRMAIDLEQGDRVSQKHMANRGSACFARHQMGISANRYPRGMSRSLSNLVQYENIQQLERLGLLR